MIQRGGEDQANAKLSRPELEWRRCRRGKRESEEKQAIKRQH